MDRTRKLELIQRSLGLRHKIKVHESMKPPETHEDLAIMLLAKWELEDELRAIEEIISEARQGNINTKRVLIEEAITKKTPIKQTKKSTGTKK